MYNKTILIGVIVSLIYTEITGYSAGLIVPGYLALNLHSPVRLIYTLLIALLAAGICKLCSQVMILYGRRRFALVLLLTFILNTALNRLHLVDLNVIGILLPGLIAREFDRQGFLWTLLGMAITTGFTALILLILGNGIILF